MKRKLQLLILSVFTLQLSAQTITITPSTADLGYYDFSQVKVETSKTITFDITTESETPIVLSYDWGSAGLGVSSCYDNVEIFKVLSISPSVSKGNPGTLIISFNPKAYTIKRVLKAKCVSNGTSNGVQSYVGDLQLKVNSTYFTTINLRGEGVLEIVGLNDSESLNSVHIYPNPTDGKMKILGDYAWSIVDIYGNELQSGFGEDLDVNHLKSGVYFVRFTKNNQIVNERFIKK